MRALAGEFDQASWRYLGIVVLLLALLAPFLAPRWRPLGFWLVVAVAGVALTLSIETPIHALLYRILPAFEALHTHVPDRALMIVPLATAMLAGAAADALATRPPIRS